MLVNRCFMCFLHVWWFVYLCWYSVLMNLMCCDFFIENQLSSLKSFAPVVTVVVGWSFHLPCDIGGAIWIHDSYFPFLNEELFGTLSNPQNHHRVVTFSASPQSSGHFVSQIRWDWLQGNFHQVIRRWTGGHLSFYAQWTRHSAPWAQKWQKMPSWNSKQPVLNGCLVKQPFLM